MIFNYLNQFKKLLLNEMAEFNYFEFEGETALDTVVEAIEQIHQIADKKLIILKESGLLRTFDKNIERVLRNIPSYDVVVFFERDAKRISKKISKIIEEIGAVVDFSRQKPSDLRAWVNIRLAREGKKMKNDDIEYFVQICDMSMSKIELELDKLIASVGDVEQIRRKDIDRVVTPLLDYKIYEMVDYVLKNDAQSAYQALREHKASNQPPTVILSMLFNQLQFIAMVKNLKMDNEPKLDEFFPPNRKFLAKKISKDSDRYPLEKIYNAMKLCADFDSKIKTGRIEGWVAVEIVIASLLTGMEFGP